MARPGTPRAFFEVMSRIYNWLAPIRTEHTNYTGGDECALARTLKSSQTHTKLSTDYILGRAIFTVCPVPICLL
jgi:hypothetical protein